MKPSLIVTFVAAAMLAIGCASGRVWYKPGATMEDFRADMAKCEYEAMLAVRHPSQRYRSEIVAAIDISLQRCELIAAGMRARGWQRITKTQAQTIGIEPGR